MMVLTRPDHLKGHMACFGVRLRGSCSKNLGCLSVKAALIFQNVQLRWNTALTRVIIDKGCQVKLPNMLWEATALMAQHAKL